MTCSVLSGISSLLESRCSLHSFYVCENHDCVVLLTFSSTRSCIAVFKSQSDYDEAEATCREGVVEGRSLLCSRAKSEDCNKLLKEHCSGPLKEGRDGLQMKLFNLPYGVKKEEIKKVFPRARNIFLPQDKEGNPTG